MRETQKDSIALTKGEKNTHLQLYPEYNNWKGSPTEFNGAYS